jgi:hypothetical protein
MMDEAMKTSPSLQDLRRLTILWNESLSESQKIECQQFIERSFAPFKPHNPGDVVSPMERGFAPFKPYVPAVAEDGKLSQTWNQMVEWATQHLNEEKASEAFHTEFKFVTPAALSKEFQGFWRSFKVYVQAHQSVEFQYVLADMMLATVLLDTDFDRFKRKDRIFISESYVEYGISSDWPVTRNSVEYYADVDRKQLIERFNEIAFATKGGTAPF